MPRTARSDIRLLLNAEPFGFGPTAAIAAFFPYLRKRFSWIGYVGKGHTLDLQRGLRYDKVHDLSGLSARDERTKLRRILSDHDLVLTAVDFTVAEAARAAGLPVCIYDPLTWYWKDIPRIARTGDLYLAQDFLGVRERLRTEARSFANPVIVPPIVDRRAPERHGKHVLINLGGLQNPFWTTRDVVTYADAIIHALRAVIPGNERVVIAANATIARALGGSVRSYSFAQMRKLLAGASRAFMTPGLGNIYDAARFDLPTIWLPPANDSQGQQADLLARHRCMDGRIDWSDILPGRGIDYAKPQSGVLKAIAARIHAFAKSPGAQAAFVRAANRQYAKIAQRRDASSSTLLKRFGSGGAEAVAKEVSTFARMLHSTRKRPSS